MSSCAVIVLLSGCVLGGFVGEMWWLDGRDGIWGGI